MFSDNEIGKTFTMGTSKTCYFFKMGWDHCWQSGCAKVFPIQKECLGLSLMKQQPISNGSKWISFFVFGTKNTNHIVTKYLGFHCFGRATTADLTSMLTGVMNSDEYEIPWKRMFYVSSDGPNIIKAVCRNLNKKLKDKGYKRLVPLIVCTLHTMHNAFRKGTSVGSFGEKAEQLAFDLHARFKGYFCCSVIVQPVDFAVECRLWSCSLILNLKLVSYFSKRKTFKSYEKCFFISPKKSFSFTRYLSYWY